MPLTQDLHYTTFDVGPTRSMTPEGFLLCRNVPIARVGTQIYGRGEIPVEAGPDGMIRIYRDEDEVFRPETIASANGKAVVDEHPEGGIPITPDNISNLGKGIVLNPRRGDGLLLDNSFLYADLLITNNDAIRAVDEGKRQVSAGYKAEYFQDRPGVGRQRNIVINHVALVDRGRCGPLCSIGDAEMPNRVKVFRDRFRKAVLTRDEEGVKAVVTELAKDPDLMGEVLSGDDLELPGAGGGEPSSHHVTINVHGGKADMGKDDVDPTAAGVDPAVLGKGADPAGGGNDLAALSARMDQIEQVLAQVVQMIEGGEEPDDQQPEAGPEESPPGTENAGEDRAVAVGDKRSKKLTGDAVGIRAMVGDSTSMRDGYLMMLSQAEILMPGIAMMTFDAARPAKDTFSDMCSFRRKTLEASKGTDAGKKAIEAVVGDGVMPKSFFDASMTCDSVAFVFNGAATLMAQANNGKGHSPSFGTNGQRNGFGARPPTPAELNAKMQEFYAKNMSH